MDRHRCCGRPACNPPTRAHNARRAPSMAAGPRGAVTTTALRSDPAGRYAGRRAHPPGLPIAPASPGAPLRPSGPSRPFRPGGPGWPAGPAGPGAICVCSAQPKHTLVAHSEQQPQWQAGRTQQASSSRARGREAGLLDVSCGAEEVVELAVERGDLVLHDPEDVRMWEDLRNARERRNASKPVCTRQRTTRNIRGRAQHAHALLLQDLCTAEADQVRLISVDA